MSDACCPVCAHAPATDLLELPAVPVLCNVLWPSRAEALAAPRGDLRLAVCPACGHVFNRAFDPARLEYTQAYENSLHFSPRFQQYAEALADDLTARYDLRGKTVVEIGCGKGEFLALLCARSGARGLGFDPSYEPGPEAAALPFTVIRDLYSARYAHYAADLIVCRHVLEHIPQPREFVRGVRAAAGERAGTAVFFEVPNVLYTLRDLGIWDLIYEHCAYFSASSLARLFAEAGLAVRAVSEQYGGQFLTLHAALGGAPAAPPDHQAVLASAETFAAAYRAKAAEWQARLGGLRRAVVWGAGSKGVTFLNSLGAGGAIEYVVDINPRKQGRHVAGTGQPIVAPDFLRAYQPEAVVVMNPLYVDEIRGQMAQLGLTPAVVCA